MIVPPAPQVVLSTPRRVSPPAAPARQERRAAPKPPTKSVKPSRADAPKTAVQALPLTREQVTSPDGMLLAGGVALFVFVLADTILLAMSSRFLRELS